MPQKDALKAQKLIFNVEDITHIIVRTESEVHYFVDAILRMKNIVGLMFCTLMVTESFSYIDHLVGED